MFTADQRRRAFRLAYSNGALWAIGNGLSSTMLVVYLANSYGAKGIAFGIAAILAAPKIVGLLRLITPWLMGQVRHRKLFCLTCYWSSAAVLLVLPLLCAPGVLPSRGISLAVLVLLWSVYHLLEYLGTIALWSWLNDIVPPEIRGSFIGVRQGWLTAASIVGMLVAGLFTYAWKSYPIWSGHAVAGWEQWYWVGYSIVAVAGALTLAVAVLPLLWLPSLSEENKQQPRFSWQTLARPFLDTRFQRLLFFGAWFGMCNGISQTAQYFYPISILGFHLLWMLSFKTGMRLGQSGTAPWVGQWVDRFGARQVMLASQIPIAAALLFFIIATPEQPWWLIGAWVLWIFYVGFNVSLPDLMLKLSPQGSSSSYIATYFAVGGLCYALSTLAGGVMFEYLESGEASWLRESLGMTHFQIIFLLGTVLRCSGVFWLLLLIEPKSR